MNGPGLRNILTAFLSGILVRETSGCAARNVPPPKPPLAPAVFKPLQAALLESYDDLFKKAPTLEFSAIQVERMREYLDQAGKHCTGRFENQAKQLDDNLRKAHTAFRRLDRGKDDTRRKQLHCRILNLRTEKTQAEALANHALPVAFENRKAKLELIEKWPAELQQIRQEFKTGACHDWLFGDVKDIGFRDVGRGREDDVKVGQDDKLMRKATIASIIYQAAQVAAIIFTGGAAGLGEDEDRT